MTKRLKPVSIRIVVAPMKWLHPPMPIRLASVPNALYLWRFYYLVYGTLSVYLRRFHHVSVALIWVMCGHETIYMDRV